MEVQRPFIFRSMRQSIFFDDFDGFQSFVDSDQTVYVNNANLLYDIIELNRRKMFEYVLSLDAFNPDCTDGFGRSLLMKLVVISSIREDYIRALIEKGANVNWVDKYNLTYLHVAAKEARVDSSQIGRLVIEKGADINAQTLNGETPLFIACLEGNIDWIHFLLYYGADVTIPSFKGILPIAATGRGISLEKQKYIHELLFDYTFDDDTQTVHFSTLAEAMVFDTNLFPKMVDKVSSVTYDVKDLERFCDNLKYVKLKNLELFLKKFVLLVKEIIDNYPILLTLVRNVWGANSTDKKRILDTFLESEYGPDLVQTCRPYCSAIGDLVHAFHKEHLYEDEVTKTACTMLSYGLEVTSLDLDTVHRFYGHCDLFKVLLHMDVVMISSDQDRQSFAKLYYNLNTRIEDFLGIQSSTCLLAFYNHPELKKLVLAHCGDEQILTKIKAMSQVPSLVELSRNVVRRYIVTRYKIRKSKRFYEVLRRFPIGKMHQEIIALEREIYSV